MCFAFKYLQTIFHVIFCEIYMEVLQELFWAPTPLKRYQNTSGWGSVITPLHTTPKSVKLCTIVLHLDSILTKIFGGFAPTPSMG